MQNKNAANRHTLRKNVIRQMHDVRPVNDEGNFDIDKIRQAEKILQILPKETVKTKQRSGIFFSDIRKPDDVPESVRREEENSSELKKGAKVYQLGQAFSSDEVPIMYELERVAKAEAVAKTEFPISEHFWLKQVPKQENFIEKRRGAESFETERAKKDYFEELEEREKISQKPGRLETVRAGLYAAREKFRESREYLGLQFNKKRFAFSFATLACAVFLLIFGTGFVKKSLFIKGQVLNTGAGAYTDLAQAKEDILNRNFQDSEARFNDAYARFDEISKNLNSLGGVLVDASRYLPYVSKLSSGAALAQAGKDVSRIGVLSGQIMQTMNEVKNPLNQTANVNNDSVSLLQVFQDTNKNAQEIQTLLVDAQNNINKVNVDDIPEAQRVQFTQLKNQLPAVNSFLTGFLANSQIFTDVLGGNGPRKYLFLFQNNQEMRATGGFIGSYGVMDIFNGRINKFFIDGIYNPDGQLHEKVVPPAPIQKISAAWSLHDSNWFPDFPTSAEKAMWFYEKTGGPTVDGVITMTPTVMQQLLAVTGPIDMPDYGVTVDKDNFMSQVQQEVEVDYDKEQNQPKKILADLAPKILDKIFNDRNFSDIAKTMNILSGSLNEKQILIYSKNYDIEKELSVLGWSGEILNTQKDYLSVINTNINGFKTDGVIDEKIEHAAEIQSDGSVVDTVTVIRHHNGGNTPYDFYNKVNADYMRVYVPQGSQLLSAEGQTREFDQPPLDYGALSFKRDAQVQAQEDSQKIDDTSGTDVYVDSGKTVFANWVYVSPQETVVVKYRYLLPFKVSLAGNNNPVDTYSLLAQKQSGSVGSQFDSTVSFPQNFDVTWKFPDNIISDKNNLSLEADLKTDKFVGVAFTKRQ